MNLGGLTLGNAPALWALLALPALVAVHFFQQRARRVRLSTRFLIESLAPESQGGRTWERFRGSRAFWLQALAVLLLAWVLAEPRWPRADSSQTVVIVLDDALAMQAVEGEARAATARLMADEAGGAEKTEWVVMGSDPRAPLRYRGAERARAEAALATWRPTLGTHDYAVALRGGRALVAAGGGGVCWFVTDREEKVPTDQAAVGVGRAFENAGFAGGVVVKTAGGGAGPEGWSWRAVVRNSSGNPQRRAWWIESAAGASERRMLELQADGVVELSGAWPAGAGRATLRLEGDAFAADDALPLTRSEWKRLRLSVEVGGETGRFFTKALAGVDGVATDGAAGAELRVAQEDGASAPRAGAAVVLAGAKADDAKTLMRAPVVAERHALVDGLNWQGLLGPGPAELKMGETDDTLLWQADKPLAWLRAGDEGRRQLVLNLAWESGNAGRLPATVLLLRRYAETVRDAQAGPYAANFDAGARVGIAAADLTMEPEAEWSVQAEGGERRVIAREELEVLRAPAEAGFFTVKRGETELVRGAAQFADARQGDFRGAGTFRRDPPAGEIEAVKNRNTQGDPLAACWLAIAGAALMWSWWPPRTGAGGTPQRKVKSVNGRREAVAT